jgi:hypothetical protein
MEDSHNGLIWLAKLDVELGSYGRATSCDAWHKMGN